MKNLQLFIFCLLLPIIFSCNKEEALPDTPPKTALEEDICEIEEYLEANGLEATEHEQGFFYSIDKQGNRTYPKIHDDLFIVYEGAYLDGDVFESKLDKPTEITVSDIMTGWFHGLRLIENGGSGILYMPAELTKGSNRPEGIAEDAILVYRIEIVPDLMEWENDIIEAYLLENSITAQKTASGIYYFIEEESDCCSPEISDYAHVNYNRSLIDGAYFKEDENVQFPLWVTDQCMAECILLLDKGEKGTFVIPSFLDCISEPFINDNEFRPWVYEFELLDFYN